ncbi:MAG TPA: DUF92 domain-containing protein [Gemmatimonadaceae bacterium]|nr:DUF92 domain-containing protein [Gemmatimonadaceae bacterium]
MARLPPARAGAGVASRAHRAHTPRRRKARASRRLTARVLAGLLLALAVALAAWRARTLSPSGVAAATLLGAIAVAAGWVHGILLVSYFVLSATLTRLGADRKARRTAAIVEKSGARDAAQVLANGSAFAVAAVTAVLHPGISLEAAAVGALAASSADTWATEVGTLWGGTPRAVWSWKKVPAGTSGGVTVRGTLGLVAGAAVIAILGWLLFERLDGPGARSTALIVAAAAFCGGVAGALLDTALGGSVQERRRCQGCGMHTERRVHSCGSRTRYAGGVRGLGNDVVNLLATVGGAGTALGVAELMLRH